MLRDFKKLLLNEISGLSGRPNAELASPVPIKQGSNRGSFLAALPLLWEFSRNTLWNFPQEGERSRWFSTQTSYSRGGMRVALAKHWKPEV